MFYLHKALALFVLVCISLDAQSVVILQYHHVSNETPRITSISPDLFATHLETIEENNFEVWPLPKVVSFLKQKKNIPSNVVVITFDDAYESIYENAFPLLKKREWPFTVFVATQPVDKKLKHYMTWDQIRELSRHGGTIANHTHSHTHMVRRFDRENDIESENSWTQRMRQELSSAEQRLVEEIGSSPKLFAYPYGEYVPQLLELVQELGLIGFGQHSGAVSSNMSLQNLPRFPMNNIYGDMKQFPAKLSSLPFPARTITPSSNLLEQPNLLSNGLKIHFYPAKLNSAQVACYLSGYGKVELEIEDTSNGIIVTTEALPKPTPGRSRINCTAPSNDPNLAGRFHWFSHYWMQKQADGSWYPEP